MNGRTGLVAPALLLALALSAACNAPAPERTRAERDAPATEAVPADEPIARDEWLRGALRAARLDRSALVAELGAPARTTAHAQPNRHDPSVTDSLVELDYPDARFIYYIVTAGSAELLDFAEVRSNAHLALTPPGIGTHADSLRSWWGAPLAASDSTLEYDCGTCEVPHPATFVIRDGRVRTIRFDLYVD